MPRQSRQVTVRTPNSNSGKKVGSLVTRGGGSIRRLGYNIVGRPSEPNSVQTFPIFRKPSYAKAGIRMLIKRNVADGLSMPEADNYTRTPGVITGDRGGFKGGVSVLLQKPLVPVKLSGTGTGRKRIVATPDKTQHAGVRSPFNQKRRVARTSQGSNKRYGK